MNLFVTLLAGLGLFFIGVRLISAHLRQLMSRRLRQLITRAVTHRGSLSVFGLLAGAIMQSVNAVIHVLVALVTAGAIERERAFAVIRWANIGTSLLVLVAVVDLHALALCLVGLTGLAYYRQLDQSTRWRHAVGALLGLGLLFLGTDFIKAGAAQLKTSAWLREEIAWAGQWLAPAFLAGAAAAWLVQSSTTLAVIAMSLAAGGLLSYDSGAMVVLGAGAGSAISAWSLAGRLEGSARQLVLFQVMLRFQGLLPLMGLWALNRWVLNDPVGALMDRWALSLPHRLVAVHLAVQFSSDLASRLLQPWTVKALQRLAPPSAQEDLSRPRFVHDDGLEEPETALLLADKEQQRLLSSLPLYLAALRDDDGPQALATPARHGAERQVQQQCEHFLTELADRHRSRAVLDRCIVLRDRNQLLGALQDTLLELEPCGLQARQNEDLDLRMVPLVESLHLMLDTLNDAARTGDPDDLALLKTLTHDRSELMDGLRRRFSDGAQDPTPDQLAQQQAYLQATQLFERCVWLLRRYVLLLDARAT